MRRAFDRRSYDCAFLNLHGYRHSDGRALTDFAHERGAAVIIVADYATDLEMARQRGYITLEKPFRPADVAGAIELACHWKGSKQRGDEPSSRL
jgi:hypothetical protein